MVDAFRWDYINRTDTPFLYNLSKKNIYVRRIKPSVGFCERTEIFTGMRPIQSKNFTALGFAPEKSFYGKYKKILKILSLIEKSIIINNMLFRKILNRIFRVLGANFQTYQIPLDLLQYFDLTEDKFDHYEEEAFVSESIFDIMRKNNKKYFYDSFTSLKIHKNKINSDQGRIKFLIDNVNSNINLYLLYLADSDTYGHLYGPDSSKMKNVMAEIDKKLENLIKAFTKKKKDTKFIVLGDHGMLGVNKYLDLIKLIKENTSLKINKDFIVFLDSTIARFWCFNEKSKIEIKEVLSHEPFLKYGIVIDKRIAKEFSIPYTDKSYGDIIWWANPGVLIFPDYFHKYKRYKGMHGYNPKDENSHGFCIISYNGCKKLIIEEGELIDICPTICDFINIPYPNNNQGKSLLYLK
ncbi:MAG: alkaline phosphatase family protein [Atribacterota bacterium]|nr:alkaline phosphatase family protein [Atribacterota bacterium]